MKNGDFAEINISFSMDGYDGVKIDKLFKGKTTKVYEGDSTNIFDKLDNAGEYLYSITPYKFLDNKKVYFSKINLSRINYNNLNEIIKQDDWWKDD